jgi:uncharacterized protein (DUF1499 family)
MRVALIPLPLALIAAALLAASGFGARFGVWDWRTGFQILRSSLYAGIAIAVLAAVFLAIPRVRRGRARGLLAALGVALGVALFPWLWGQSARAVPPINDITTDTDNPPTFVAVVPLRAGVPVPSTYPGGDTAQKQHQAYPDIKPLELAVPPAAAHDRALAAARDMGWQIVADDAATGRIEATATTPWFGFHDDVVVRITAAASGSRVDVRSVSRVGKGDLGTNARRIRAYLAKLAA